jgi:ribosome maturation factor RimP
LAGKGNTVSRVTEIITPYAEELGLDIWDVRFAKEGTDWYLRIFIDKEGLTSVTQGLCSKLTMKKICGQPCVSLLNAT